MDPEKGHRAQLSDELVEKGLELAGLTEKSEDQRQGFACWHCGARKRPMRPVPGIRTPESAQVFACAEGC